MLNAISTGALIGLVIGGLAVLVFFIIALNKKPAIGMKSRKTTEVETTLKPAEAISRIRDRAGSHGLTVPVADEGSNRLVLADGMSLFSWGMHYPVSAIESPNGAIVIVGVAPKTPQWGPVIPHKLNKTVGRIQAMLSG